MRNASPVPGLGHVIEAIKGEPAKPRLWTGSEASYLGRS